jgi:hypothetical protein
VRDVFKACDVTESVQVANPAHTPKAATAQVTKATHVAEAAHVAKAT